MKKYIVGILIGFIIALLLLLKVCNKPANTSKPEVITVKEQIEKVVKDSLAVQRAIDSLNFVVDIWESETQKYKKELSNTNSLYDKLENDYRALLENLPNDNSENNAVKEKFEKLAASCRKKDTTCNATINSLQKTISAKNQIIIKKDTALKNLRKSFDLSLAQQQKLSDYIDDNKKRTQIFLGASLFGQKDNWVSGAGASIGMITKKNDIIEAGAFTMNKVVNYSISYKRIISFRKRK